MRETAERATLRNRSPLTTHHSPPYKTTMNDLWPGLCAAAALIALLVLIIRYRVHAFIAMFVVSLGLGLAAGLPPAQVVDVINRGIADILREVLLLLALGAMLGRMLETSGAAELIARRI